MKFWIWFLNKSKSISNNKHWKLNQKMFHRKKQDLRPYMGKLQSKNKIINILKI